MLVMLAMMLAWAEPDPPAPEDAETGEHEITWGDVRLSEALRRERELGDKNRVLLRIIRPYLLNPDWPRNTIAAGFGPGFGGPGASGLVRVRGGLFEGSLAIGPQDDTSNEAQVRLGALYPLPGVGRRTLGIHGFHVAPAIGAGVHLRDKVGVYVAPSVHAYGPFAGLSTRLNVDVGGGYPLSVRPEVALELDGLWRLFDPGTLHAGSFGGGIASRRYQTREIVYREVNGRKVAYYEVVHVKEEQYQRPSGILRFKPISNFVGPMVLTGMPLGTSSPEFGAGLSFRGYGLGAEVLARHSVYTPGTPRTFGDGWNGPFKGKLPVLEVQGMAGINVARMIGQWIGKGGNDARLCTNPDTGETRKMSCWHLSTNYGRLMLLVGVGWRVPLGQPQFADPDLARATADQMFANGQERSADVDPTQARTGTGGEVGWAYEFGSAGVRAMTSVGRGTGYRASVQLTYTIPVRQARNARGVVGQQATIRP